MEMFPIYDIIYLIQYNLCHTYNLMSMMKYLPIEIMSSVIDCYTDKKHEIRIDMRNIIIIPDIGRHKLCLR